MSFGRNGVAHLSTINSLMAIYSVVDGCYCCCCWFSYSCEFTTKHSQIASRLCVVFFLFLNMRMWWMWRKNKINELINDTQPLSKLLLNVMWQCLLLWHVYMFYACLYKCLNVWLKHLGKSISLCHPYSPHQLVTSVHLSERSLCENFFFF